MKEQVAVVVGGGVAGATCAAELSAICADDPNVDVRVVLVTASPVVRVATAGTLRREVEVSDTPGETWATATGISVVHGVAAGISGHSITLADGSTVTFDVCCLATGARPVLPASLATADPLLRERVLLLRDSDSVATMRAAILGARQVAIVGNGGIGLELAHEIDSCDVTWIIKDNHVGNSFFDVRGGDVMFRFLQNKKKQSEVPSTAPPLGSLPQPPRKSPQLSPPPPGAPLHSSGVGPNWLSQRGGPTMYKKDGSECPRALTSSQRAPGENRSLRVERNCTVNMVRNGDGDWPVALELSNGSIVLCDVVMCATGVTPNVEWLRGGLDVAVDSGDDDALLGHDASGGVLVKAGNMQSATQPSVFGAGDCVTIMRSSDMTAASGNNWFQMRLWTQAAATGRVAAAGMAAHLRANGSDADVGLEFELFAHGTRFFGQKVALLGRYNAQGLEGGYQVLEGGGGEDDDYFIRVVIEDGKVRGALLIGDTELSETYENLILDRFDVGHLGAELVDPSIDLSDVFD
jgi:pyridine nucleotide-disulfide oxidoreductase domain-containing protein 1